jgi:ribose 5-phosphate isomerase A
MLTRARIVGRATAATAAVDLVSSDSILGLGSGSTLAFFLELLGERVRSGQLRIVGVPTSYQTRLLARQYGIPIRDAIDIDHVDVTIDGADEIDAGVERKRAAAASVAVEAAAVVPDASPYTGAAGRVRTTT